LRTNIFTRIFQLVGLRKRPNTDEWVDTKGKVPQWVKVEISKIKKKYGGASSALANKYWTIQGKHYKYRLEFCGQNGSTAVILKKRV
jgi:hypothetical protein